MTDKKDMSELTKGLLTDFKKSTALHVLNNIVFLVQQALAQLSAASTSRFIALMTLVDALYARFNHSYDLSDLNEAISSLQEANTYCTERDQQELNINFRICGLLATRFDVMGDIPDLQTALDWAIKGTETFTGVLELLEFASELHKQFTMSGNMADLNTAGTLFRQKIATLPQGSENYAALVSNFAVALQTQQNVLNEAISLHRLALELRPPPHPLRSNSLNSLASALSTRFHRGDQQSDLNEAISLYQQALELQLAPNPNQSSLLSNLANALWTRFQKGGQQSDLNEAISLKRQSLKLQPLSHPN